MVYTSALFETLNVIEDITNIMIIILMILLVFVLLILLRNLEMKTGRAMLTIVVN